MKPVFPRATFTMLVVSSLYSVGLIFLRYELTTSTDYFFLIWNLILAWIPFVISLLLSKYYQHRNLFYWLGLLVWLLFLPNAFYIITDLVHLNKTGQIDFWFDLVMVASFVWNGLLLGFVSLKLMHDLVQKVVGEVFSWILIQGVLLLAAVGIYFGRFLGFNSWDVVAHPFGLETYLANSFISTGGDLRGYAVVFFFYVFLAVTYGTFRSLQSNGKMESELHV